MVISAKSESMSSRSTGLLSATGRDATRLRFSGQKCRLAKILALCLLASVASSCTKDAPPKYAIGDQGPGMGTVFYVADEPFLCGSELRGYCSFLEVAPAGWSGDDTDPVSTMSIVPYKYSQYVKDYIATEPVGLGMHNTLVFTSDTNSPASAVDVAAQYTGGGLRDWYLPSRDELTLLQKSQSSSMGLKPDVYWSSSEYDAWGEFVWVAHMDPIRDAPISDQQFIPLYPHLKADRAYVRPVRAF